MKYRTLLQARGGPGGREIRVPVEPRDGGVSLVCGGVDLCGELLFWRALGLPIVSREKRLQAVRLRRGLGEQRNGESRKTYGKQQSEGLTKGG